MASPEDLTCLVRLRHASAELDDASDQFPGLSYLINLLVEYYEVICAEWLESHQMDLLQKRSDARKKKPRIPTDDQTRMRLLSLDGELIRVILNPLLQADIVPNDRFRLPDEEDSWEDFLNDGDPDDEE